MVTLDLDQPTPNTADALRAAEKAKLTGVRGKGRTRRNVSCSPKRAPRWPDCLERERPTDASDQAVALFLSAVSIGSRQPDGRLSPRSVNTICEQIGSWHDAEHTDHARRISPLRPMI